MSMNTRDIPQKNTSHSTQKGAPIITLSHITKTYHTGEIDVPVLKGIDLEIHRGEYVALMGRSGAGKSTLMNILGCLDRPSGGSYILEGQDVSTLDDDTISQVRGRTIGFIFQSFHLLGTLDIEENVQLPMEYQGWDLKTRQNRSRMLLERVGLGHRLGHYPNQLSGGERQRVAIARALANKPTVLLADEPTGNLDSQARQNILDLFNELLLEEDLTLITVTHDPLIGALAERLVRVSDGRILRPEQEEKER